MTKMLLILSFLLSLSSQAMSNAPKQNGTDIKLLAITEEALEKDLTNSEELIALVKGKDAIKGQEIVVETRRFRCFFDANQSLCVAQLLSTFRYLEEDFVTEHLTEYKFILNGEGEVIKVITVVLAG